LGGATAVVVTGRYAALGTCTGSASQTIPSIAPAAPAQLTSLTLQAPGGTATFAIGGLLAGYRYSLQSQPFAGGAFTDVQGVTITPGSPTPLTLPNASAGNYRIFSSDVCGGSPQVSNVIGTLSLAVTSADNRNQLLLTGAAGPYTVLRNNSPVTLTTTPRGLEDTDVQCGTAYTYVVTATQPGGGRSISNPDTITTVSQLPPPRPRLVASFNQSDVVELTPLLTTPALPVGSTLRYGRSLGGQPERDFGSRNSARIVRDSTTSLAALLAASPCYTVRQVDCGILSPVSASACPALLTVSAADPEGTTTTLRWTSFAGPDPSQPATYTLQRLAADGTVLPGSVVVTGNTYTDLTPPTDRQVARYRLQISGAGLPAGIFSYSNRANLTRRLTLTIPTAFTPNGDGLNDVLEVKGRYLSNYTFVVVDRNGQEVFRGTQRSETWDGTIKGHAPVLGAYIWRFRQDNEDGQPFSATGTVTILK
jgi:gliding motility-associated-like protein